MRRALQLALIRRRRAAPPSAGGTSATRYSAMGSGFRSPVGPGQSNGGTYAHRVAKSAFGSPDYVTTDPLFGFANWSHNISGAEFNGGCDIIIRDLKLFFGGQWYATTDKDHTITPGSSWLMNGFAGLSIPANTLVYWVCQFEFSALSVTCPNLQSSAYWNGGVTTLGDATQGFTTQAAAAAFMPSTGAGSNTSWGNNGTGFFYGPSMCFAKGGDGRPAIVIVGDSIGYGANQDTQYGSWTARREHGLVNMGLDDNTTSKRLAYLNLCVHGQNPVDPTAGWKNRPRWEKKLDLVKQVTTLQGGVAPFDIIISEMGENSLTPAKTTVGLMPSYYATLKAEWPGLPIYQHEVLPKPSSTDQYRTLGNQGFLNANESNRDAVASAGGGLGDKWLFNAACAAGGAFRTSGDIVGSIPAWQYGAYDLTTNRDKLAIRPFTTTTTSALSGGQMGLAAAATPGMHLCAATAGAGYIGVARTYGAGLLNIEGVAQGFASPTIGDTVWEIPHDTAGLHPSGVMHKVYQQAYIDWKIAQGYV